MFVCRMRGSKKQKEKKIYTSLVHSSGRVPSVCLPWITLASSSRFSPQLPHGGDHDAVHILPTTLFLFLKMFFSFFHFSLFIHHDFLLFSWFLFPGFLCLQSLCSQLTSPHHHTLCIYSLLSTYTQLLLLSLFLYTMKCNACASTIPSIPSTLPTWSIFMRVGYTYAFKHDHKVTS